MNVFNKDNPIFRKDDPIMKIIHTRNALDDIEASKPSYPEDGEVEVYRLTPEEGKYYETAEYTRKTGLWSLKNEKYYTKNPLKYVGLFIKTVRTGYGDGSQSWSIFDNCGEEVRVHYTYEGTTSFVEISGPSDYVLK